MVHQVAVIGGGPAGAMAAIKAGELIRGVLLIERNSSIGRKLMITGKGRCNITNTAGIDLFIKKFTPAGEFLRSAFYAMSNEDLMEFFRSRGLELRVERQGRVFPATDKAQSAVSVLEESLKRSGVEVMLETRIKHITGSSGMFTLVSEAGIKIEAKRIIIATGGASYKVTGSTGDGYVMASETGHKITNLRGALIPLRAKESWLKDLQGLALENISIRFRIGKRWLESPVGELMFTHFGVSGPLVLDMSHLVVAALEKQGKVMMEIDLKPGLSIEQLEARLVRDFARQGTLQIKSVMQELLPKRMVIQFLSLAGIPCEKRANQIVKSERQTIIGLLKSFNITISGSLPIEEGMVTAGGVSMKDINPRTMESKILPGLYFAGEVIEGAAPSGGYNLQQAFSTGCLAGQKAVESLDEGLIK